MEQAMALTSYEIMMLALDVGSMLFFFARVWIGR
jgi:hypothetical protein